MSHLSPGLDVGTRRCIIKFRAIIMGRLSSSGTNPINSFLQKRRSCYNNPLIRRSNRLRALSPPSPPRQPKSLGAYSSSSTRYPFWAILPTRSHSYWSSSGGGAINRRLLSHNKNISSSSYRGSAVGSKAGEGLGLPSSLADNSSTSTVSNSDSLLRRVASYIEEDPRAAEKLGEALGEGTRNRLSTTLDGMRYAVREPSGKELRMVAFVSGVPFVGFGLMDNAIMIVAGEYIDMTVGVALGISTMAAAGLGNTISDVAGVGLGGFIESVATRLGLPPIKLSRAQMLLRSTRIASLVGSAVGVCVGCLIGMFPLLFLPDGEVVEAVKRKEKIVGLIDAVVEEAAAFLSASSATLFIMDKEKGILWARRRGQPGSPNADDVQDLKLKLEDKGPVSRAARLGEAVSVQGPKRNGGSAGHSVLCMPVLGPDGDVAGVVQVVGKKGDSKALDGGFTTEDAKDLSALCSHISVALENIKRTEESYEMVDLRETISLMRSYGGVNHQQRLPQYRSSTSPSRRV